MSQHLFLQLLAKQLAGEATEKDLALLDEMMRAHPEWMFSAQHIADFWNMEEPVSNGLAAEAAFEQHLQRMALQGKSLPGETEPEPLPAPVSRRRPLVVMAALLALVLLAAGVYFLLPTQPHASAPAQLSEVQTRAGSRSRLILPDSSVVWLNAGSRLSYPEGFGRRSREVTLSGEAYFDVRHSSIPFVIHTPAIRISVLGTAFNVKSYPNEKTTETSIVRGKVEVTLNDRPGEKFILEHDEKLVVAHRGTTERRAPGKAQPTIVLGRLTHLQDSSIVETCWVDNKLAFVDESFAEVARRMERWYNVQIEIGDEKIAETRLTGTFENESVLDALSALQITTPFHFTQNKERILIGP